ncbi:MAG: hypothetical protein KDA42_04980 [Planctomycetales bacterium]|nr:hypothetical protein [Planctomycetales bacterium]
MLRYRISFPCHMFLTVVCGVLLVLSALRNQAKAAEPDVRAPVVQAQAKFAKVDLAGAKRLSAGQQGVLVRGGQVVDVVKVTSVKDGYFVCRTTNQTPQVGDEVALELGAAAPPTPAPTAGGSPSNQRPTADVAKQLESLEGKQIELQLKVGPPLRDVLLVRLLRDKSSGEIRSLRIRENGKAENRSLLLTQLKEIRAGGRVVADEETLRELAGIGGSDSNRRGKSALLAEVNSAKQEEERERWLARLEVRGIDPWPELSDDEHDEAVAKHKQFVEEIGAAFPGMALHETKNFLFYTNIPPQQVGPYVVSLDAMHDMMCKMYNIEPGSRVWRGKALVVAFLEQAEFMQFEARFMRTAISPGIYGLCHQKSDGEVVIGCYRGDRAEEFAQMLVHETSHGFIHRYKTPVHFPNWVNEGMADWVGLALVPNCQSVKLAERRAVDIMKQTRSMGGDFLEREHIDSWQYGLASNLADFMIRTNRKAYVQFIEGMKEGMTWEESLQASYGSSPEQLVAAYGQAIGVPDLRP